MMDIIVCSSLPWEPSIAVAVASMMDTIVCSILGSWSNILRSVRRSNQTFSPLVPRTKKDYRGYRHKHLSDMSNSHRYPLILYKFLNFQMQSSTSYFSENPQIIFFEVEKRVKTIRLTHLAGGSIEFTSTVESVPVQCLIYSYTSIQ